MDVDLAVKIARASVLMAMVLSVQWSSRESPALLEPLVELRQYGGDLRPEAMLEMKLTDSSGESLEGEPTELHDPVMTPLSAGLPLAVALGIDAGRFCAPLGMCPAIGR